LHQLFPTVRSRWTAAALAATIILALIPAGFPGRIAAWAATMLLPGAALYWLTGRRTSALESLTGAFVLSPVITCVLCVLFMWAGISVETGVRGIITLAGIAGIAGIVVADRGRREPGTDQLSRRQWVAAGALILATLVLVGYLPQTSEWWRFRSDAWFHGAVVEQIAGFGLPPTDPFFAGYELQYMWFYHVTVLALSRAASLDPFRVMSFINLQCLAGMFLATLLFAGIFVRSFGRRIGSCILVAFGMNGLVWLFLPLKAIRALTGEVTGAEELGRTFSLSPFDLYTAKTFLTVYYNQEFFLDKFVVMTALGLAFSCMAMFWWACAEYLKSRRPYALIAASLCLVGMLGFHTLFGFVMTAAAGGGLVLSLIFRRRGVDGYRLRTAVELAIVLAASAAATAPYLYSITRLKEKEYVFPFGFSFEKAAGILITCAAVIVLAAFQRWFFAARDAAARFVQFGLAATVLFCALIVLPDSNTYDKLPLFVFYPLAVIGGWTLSDMVTRRRSAAARAAAALALSVMFLVPVNAISFAAYFNTHDEPKYTGSEVSAAEWIRDNTARDAVFIDDNEKVFLLLAGPRQYYCGKIAYARQWGYTRLEMAERFHARDTLLGGGDLDLTTLRLMSEAPWALYVIVRGEERAAPAVSRHPELFRRVYSGGDIALYEVIRGACGRAAGSLKDTGGEETPPQQLLQDSGLNRAVGAGRAP
jgi:hypothetical protein